ncbi:hypothetical protein [Methylobacter sp.]
MWPSRQFTAQIADPFCHGSDTEPAERFEFEEMPSAQVQHQAFL